MTNIMQVVLHRLAVQDDISALEMQKVLQTIMSGGATQAQIGAFLFGLHCKGESVEELTTAANFLRELATPVTVKGTHIVDIVGTGGDKARTFNISTTAAFVAAAAGVKVAKHNNRAISSSSGSADLLELAGINPILTANQVGDCIEQIGIGFMFAPQHHSALQQVGSARRELAIRTIFNLLGPLANPANVPNQIVGVPAAKWVPIFAEVLQKLGNQHVLVVHSLDGLDEISIAAPTQAAELKDGNIKNYFIEPPVFGIPYQSIEPLRVNNAQESFALMQQVLANQAGPALDIVSLNAGAAIYAANLVVSLAEGIDKARTVIANGAALQKFHDLQKFVKQLN